MNLSQVSVGSSAIIRSVGGEGKIRRRLLDMGVTSGTLVTVKKKAPLGDPVEVTLRGYELTLRKNEAQCVEVEEVKK